MLLWDTFYTGFLEDLTIVMFVVQVGDGTTTVVLLAGEFLKEAKPFIEDGVHPQNLIRSYRIASNLVDDLTPPPPPPPPLIMRCSPSCILHIMNNVAGT